MLSVNNGIIKIEVASKGAELQSLFDIGNQYEWLWQGDPAHWGKRAPLLFPFVGCVKEGQYTYEGKTYPMSKHGFARDMDFELRKVDDHTIEAVLRANPETRRLYPFEFELILRYQLEGSALKLSHEVRNLGEGQMIFSLGGHPAFNCPGEYTDWQIAFEAPEDLISLEVCLKDGLIGEGKRNIGKSIGNLVLMHELFEKDAVIFKGLKSQAVTLTGPEAHQQLNFDYRGFPLIAFWSPNTSDAPFVCLEPWFGMADPVGHNGKLEDKPETVILEPNTSFTAVVTMTLRGILD